MSPQTDLSLLARHGVWIFCQNYHRKAPKKAPGEPQMFQNPPLSPSQQAKIDAGTHKIGKITEICGSDCNFNWDDDGELLNLKWGANAQVEIVPLTKRERPLCGARCRSGQPCKARVVKRADESFTSRCVRHGGASTGPKTPEGRARIAESNRRRAKNREVSP